jgi:thiamine pyrophosphokinase
MVTKNKAREEREKFLRCNKSSRETRAKRKGFSTAHDYNLALDMLIGDYDPINKKEKA